MCDGTVRTVELETMFNLEQLKLNAIMTKLDVQESFH